MTERLPDFDICVIGSGFGAVMAAHPFVVAGYRVVMLERGDWVTRGPHNWAPEGTGDATPYYNRESAYRVIAGGVEPTMGAYHCVGGPSVFYGGVSLRFREADFQPPADIVDGSGAAWPFGYATLAPYYDEAERLLDVAGVVGEDPTEPPRSAPYTQQLPPTSDASEAIAAAGRALSLRPFRLPLAINYRAGERGCHACPTCDTFACAVSAKNDLATCLIPELQRRGLQLEHNTVVVSLRREGRRIVQVDARRRNDGVPVTIRARRYVLAAGALASPLLVLASRLDEVSPARAVIGHYLMRHVNAIVFGLFPRAPGRLDTFHKQVGFHDLYFGVLNGRGPKGRLGALQQVHSPPVALVKLHMPVGIGTLIAPLARRMTGLLAIAEDQPRAANHVRVSASARDRFGLPQLEIEHRYSARDRRAIRILTRQARAILGKAGARLYYTHNVRTFSHAVGTLRMGSSEKDAPVDALGRFRGLENLLVADGSVFPTAAAVSPSLTIAALALRAAHRALEEGWAS